MYKRQGDGNALFLPLKRETVFKLRVNCSFQVKTTQKYCNNTIEKRNGQYSAGEEIVINQLDERIEKDTIFAVKKVEIHSNHSLSLTKTMDSKNNQFKSNGWLLTKTIREGIMEVLFCFIYTTENLFKYSLTVLSPGNVILIKNSVYNATFPPLSIPVSYTHLTLPTIYSV